MEATTCPESFGFTQPSSFKGFFTNCQPGSGCWWMPLKPFGIQALDTAGDVLRLQVSPSLAIVTIPVPTPTSRHVFPARDPSRLDPAMPSGPWGHCGSFYWIQTLFPIFVWLVIICGLGFNVACSFSDPDYRCGELFFAEGWWIGRPINKATKKPANFQLLLKDIFVFTPSGLAFIMWSARSPVSIQAPACAELVFSLDLGSNPHLAVKQLRASLCFPA